MKYGFKSHKKRRSDTIVKLFITMLFGLMLVGCAYMPLVYGPAYKGRVVDQTTGEPIAGVVAVGYWSYMIPNLGGGTTRCVDARETVTDAKGEFEIPNVSYREFRIVVYKVGYRSVGCYWEDVDKPGACFEKPGEFDGDRAVFPLKQVAETNFLEEGNPPHISCGRKDKKPLSAWHNEKEKFRFERKKIKETLK
jgi:hypothetical protein